MAAAKRYSAEQIVAKRREAEKLQGQGATIPAVCKKLGVSEQTFHRWRTKYGALKENEAHRLKALEIENARLKRLVAEQALDISMLRDLSRGNFRARLGAGTRWLTWSRSSGSRSGGRAGWPGSTARATDTWPCRATSRPSSWRE